MSQATLIAAVYRPNRNTLQPGETPIVVTGKTCGDVLAAVARAGIDPDDVETINVGPLLARAIAAGKPPVGWRITDDGVAELGADEVETARLAVEAHVDDHADTWTGRDWDDGGTVVTPKTSDEVIVDMLRRDGEVRVTSWGIPEDACHPVAERWHRDVRWHQQRLAEHVTSAGEALTFTDCGRVVSVDGVPPASADAVASVAQVCDCLRALAQRSDDRVAEHAANALRSARAAVECARAGDVPGAVEAAHEAARIERAYGDDPTWGPLVLLVERWAELREQHPSGDEEISSP